MSEIIDVIAKSRKNYLDIRRALPWLDCWVSPLKEDQAQMKLATAVVPTDFVVSADASAPGEARLVICRKGLEVPAGDALLLLKSNEFSDAEIGEFAAGHPDRKVIIVTGYKKILYYISQFRELMLQYSNLYLCTANLCNMDALERLVAAGLADRLLYGSFMPFMEADASMGPLVMARLDWQTKCAIAGNNLRRLLGEEPVVPEAVDYLTPERPYFIDAHAHTVYPETPMKFEAPAGSFDWEYYRQYMDHNGCQCMFMIPSEANVRPEISSWSIMEAMLEKSGSRIAFMETFNPNDVAVSLEFLKKALPMESCVGIKIHPASHKVSADDPRYREVFLAAREGGKPIMTHSWAVSDYNPTQKFSCPELFEKYFEEFPDVTFVLGHAGGRPESIDQVIRLCKKFPQVNVDVSGDYFNNGVTETLLKEVGADRIMLASDTYWIDQRCELGMYFSSSATDEELADIFMNNARRIYNWQFD